MRHAASTASGFMDAQAFHGLVDFDNAVAYAARIAKGTCAAVTIRRRFGAGESPHATPVDDAQPFSASRMTPTGGSTPLQRANAAAAWCTSIPSPP